MSEDKTTTQSQKLLMPVAKESFTLQELRVAQVFVGVFTAAVFLLVIGGIWSIGDIFSQDKFGAFLTLSLYSQLFLVGIIVIGLFILSVFLVVFYRRGRDSILRALFKEKPKDRDAEEYLPAKIISAGALISIFVVVLGLLIALIEFLVNGWSDASGFWSFLGELTGGLRILIIAGFIWAFGGLALGAVYSWQNGYYFVVNIILRRNKEVAVPTQTYTKQQKITGQIFFGITVASVAVIVFGIIFAIIDAVAPTGAWDSFKGYPIGIQFSIIGTFVAGLFFLLVGAMTIYRWGNYVISNALFIRMQPVGMQKDNSSAKIIAAGILAGIFLIAFSLTVWLLSLWIGAFGENVTNPFESLANMSGGLLMLTIGLLILVFVILILGFAYIFNNGYYLIVKKIIEAQEKLNKSMDTGIKIEKKEKKKDPEPPSTP
jgi:hypothetical protein